LNVGTGPGKPDASQRSNRRDVEHFDRWAATYDRSWTQRIFFATRGRRERFHTLAEIGGMLREAGFAQIEWHDIYRIGPLLLVADVTARKG
jgi:hypothetical protein